MIKTVLSGLVCITLLGDAFASEGTTSPDPVTEPWITSLMDDMVWVEGGTFTMGSNSEKASPAEQPEHQVTVSGFHMGKFEVSQQLFQEIMGWDQSYFAGEGYPVNNLSWFNIQRFVERLNTRSGKHFRLPTEAEWEYAARGGVHSKGYRFSGSDNIDEVAWWAGNAGKKLHPSGLKKPNELGLYDMTGNLWEFCHDEADMRPYPDGPRTDPVVGSFEEITSNRARITRGGGYEFDQDESLVFRRDGATPNVRLPDIGFRLVMTEPPESPRK